MNDLQHEATRFHFGYEFALRPKRRQRLKTKEINRRARYNAHFRVLY